MIYQNKFELTRENGDYFSSQIDILILGSNDLDNKRNNYVRSNLNEFKGITICLDVCEQGKKLSYIILSSKDEVIEEEKNLPLIKDLLSLLKRLECQEKKICVDITTLSHALIFYLTKLLLIEIKPKFFFAAYTEPLEYVKKSSAELEPFANDDEYDLFTKMLGQIPIPGFAKSADRRRPNLLVSAMGFEAHRLLKIYDDLKPSEFIPIVGFPSFVPGWNLTSVKMNWMVLKMSDAFDSIKKCEASSPFAIYELLGKIYDQHIGNSNIYIAPLGTRPHSLGSALFASKNSAVYLIYDFPVEKLNRSRLINKANIYNLSNFID